MDCLIVGAGFVGSVIARELAERGFRVTLWERRNHSAGNMFDYTDSHGILVHKYGPHTFHTNDEALYQYICRYGIWKSYHLCCGAVVDEIETPTPFNFRTIDQFFPQEAASSLKKRLQTAYPHQEVITILEALQSNDAQIRDYAQWLFEKDYAPYTAKQWGLAPDKIAPSVLERVPLRLSYHEGYFSDAYQVMPEDGYTNFFNLMLNHKNIKVELGVEGSLRLAVVDDGIKLDGMDFEKIVVFTGAVDELFNYRAGELPYRSLRFEWHHADIDSFQAYPVVAHPVAEEFTRITEYRKLPPQDVSGTTYAVEFPLQYSKQSGMEPYYPVLTHESRKQLAHYQRLTDGIENLFLCGRLADFKYYNMDQALARALDVSKTILERLERRSF